MEKIKKVFEQAKTARESVVQHMLRTFFRAALYAVVAVGFWMAIQDSGWLFWVPSACMVVTAIISLVKIMWASIVGIILWKVDSKVEDAQAYTEVAIGISELAKNQITKRREPLAQE